jgi:hypothetical protein
MVALARSPVHVLEICDVVLRLLAASVVHSVFLGKWSYLNRALINAASLAYLMNEYGRNSHQFQWQVQAEQHLQCTRRILHNLQTPTLGIPLPTGATKQEDTIVALATLRASVAQLQSVLEASKDNTV